ncbi:MBL fold metallo-hydrolase [Jannaschia sp. S6380]|uniref:MBL fold metallo-hydrolase n=1 Tax=Jannaschia sp. S6380 TaxID=2926408 RepID=UPI001FF11BB4|nr:MBL fold metallo-hydrolase [Jannaschia sp. S6380]MCK0167560.1 MBL fold metallo-hydrolase [Jannaschia sp. S6380]
MKRRTLLGLAGMLGIGACATREVARGNPYYSGPISDHFDGTRFFNPGGAPPRGFTDLLRWHFGETGAEWPDSVAVTPTVPQTRVAGLRVTMVGHATVLVQAGGANILVDPVWSRRVSPFSFAGPARVTAPGIAFDDLPPIDAVLVSHNHYDHMDIATLRRLHARDRVPIVTPLGNDTILRGAIDGVNVRVGDWGDRVEVAGVAIRLLPCHHWSARGTRDRSFALWCSFAVETPAGRVLACGDTGYDSGRPYAAAARHGPYRLAIIPIGAYAPRWFMRHQHQNPEEAVAGFAACGAENALAAHWGTFQLTNEAREEPPERLALALRAADVEPDRFRALPPGGVWDVRA